MDIEKPDYSDAIRILELTETLERIEKANLQYADLIQQRSATQIATRLGKARPVRRENDQFYDVMMSLVFATDIYAPTEATATFITKQNKLIDEVRSL